MKGSVWGGAGATAADGGCAARPASEQHWGGSGEIRRVGGGRAACAPDSPPRRRPAGRRRERARVRDTACLSAQPTRAALPLPPGAQPPPPPTARTRGQCGGAPGSACARGNGHPYGWAWMARRRVTAAETHTAYGRALDVSCCCFLFFFFFFLSCSSPRWSTVQGPSLAGVACAASLSRPWARAWAMHTRKSRGSSSSVCFCLLLLLQLGEQQPLRHTHTTSRAPTRGHPTCRPPGHRRVRGASPERPTDHAKGTHAERSRRRPPPHASPFIPPKNTEKKKREQNTY